MGGAERQTPRQQPPPGRGRDPTTRRTGDGVEALMIEAQELTRRFGDVVAADRVSLHVPGGAILALLGPNGAGKTTTVRVLAGLIAPSSGRAVVAGRDVQADPAGVRARVGLVTDVPGLH